MKNQFIKEIDTYQRNIDPAKHYVEQMSLLVQMQTNWPIEQCEQYVKGKIASSPRVNNPVVRYYQREENGDRHEKQARLTDFIQEIVDQNEILAPSFTTYKHASHKVSLISIYAKGNAIKRGVIKKKAFAAKSAGKMDQYDFFNAGQTNAKLANNAVSGALCTKSSVIYNPTGHSTLTSTVRTGTSFGNANNERLLNGNRHYWSSDIVIANILSTISTLGDMNDPTSDAYRLQSVMDKYNLYYPTIEDTIACITYSSDWYWRNLDKLSTIEDVVSRLSPLERAYFVYNGDLYHIRKLNDAFMRTFITALSAQKTDRIDNPLDRVKNIDAAILNLSHEINGDLSKGKGTDYKNAFSADGSIHAIVSTGEHISQTLDQYQDFIDAFFVNSNVPPTIAHIAHMVRGVVALSDTDSSGACADEWVEWYRGQVMFDTAAFATSGAVAYISAQTISHILATYSANINVAKEHLFTIAMKNEFTFPVIVPTAVSKHYYATISTQEGNVWEKNEMEIKGVHLKSSNIPARIMDNAKRVMQEICDTVTNGDKLSLKKYLSEFIEMEKTIQRSLQRGELEFYRQIKIKDKTSYTKGPKESNYQHYTFWMELFASKYNYAPTVPYNVIKIPTILENPTKTKQYIEAIKDPAVRSAFFNWLTEHNRTEMKTLYIPADYAQMYGIPEELVELIDVRKIVMDLTNVNRIILDSIGFNAKADLTLTEMQGQ